MHNSVCVCVCPVSCRKVIKTCCLRLLRQECVTDDLRRQAGQRSAEEADSSPGDSSADAARPGPWRRGGRWEQSRRELGRQGRASLLSVAPLSGSRKLQAESTAFPRRAPGPPPFPRQCWRPASRPRSDDPSVVTWGSPEMPSCRGLEGPVRWAWKTQRSLQFRPAANRQPDSGGSVQKSPTRARRSHQEGGHCRLGPACPEGRWEGPGL